MDQQTTLSLISGGFALGGALGGVLLSGRLTHRADKRRLKAEDDRRWLTDRRTTYANFLGLAESMLREVDGVAVFLSYDGSQPIPEDDEELIVDGLSEYFQRWDDELQPELGEGGLLASPEVADLADRVSGGLMEVTVHVERRDSFAEYYPSWFQAQDLLEVLRNAMRVELGLPAMSKDRPSVRRTGDWPWLPDRPPKEFYVQHHPARTKDVSRR